MICPECKSEFIEGVTFCPDCEIPLVHYIEDDLTAKDEPKEDYNFVLVYNPISSQEVSLIKMIMERENIPYFIKNDPLHKSVIFSTHGPGNIELYVDERFAEDTVKLLRNELGHE
jgi:hypothetical protein